MILNVVEAKYLEDYKMIITFNDGSNKIIDLEKTVFEDNRKIFRELQDINQFKNFRIDYGTVCWANGLDLAPEYLKNLENIGENSLN